MKKHLGLPRALSIRAFNTFILRVRESQVSDKSISLLSKCFTSPISPKLKFIFIGTNDYNYMPSCFMTPYCREANK